MSEPRTEAGRRVMRQDYRGNPAFTVTPEDIAAIEREARSTEVCWHRVLTDGMLARALAHADIAPPLRDIARAGTELRREMGFEK